MKYGWLGQWFNNLNSRTQGQRFGSSTLPILHFSGYVAFGNHEGWSSSMDECNNMVFLSPAENVTVKFYMRCGI